MELNFLNKICNWLSKNQQDITDYLQSMLLTIIITYGVIFIIRFLLHQFFKRTNFIDEKREQTIESVVKNTSGYIAFFIILFAGIDDFFPIKKLLVAGGVLGVVIGFGAQSIIRDILYGFFFLFEGQFKKGDFVQINGEVDGGTVEDLGFRSVKIRLVNGKVMNVANGQIIKVVNGNIDQRRIFESVIVSFRENPIRVKEILQEICDELNERHKDYLRINKETNDYTEVYRVYGLSSLDSSPLGYRFSICATVNDTDYVAAVQEAKELLAFKMYEQKIIMPEQNVFYKTRSSN